MGIFTKDIKSMEDLLIHGCRTSITLSSKSSNRCPR